MSKRLPYYQSEPAEYLSGDIMFCSYASQGVFTIIRALYWQKDCELTLTQIKRRIPNSEDSIKELIDENIIKIHKDNISISFLDVQFEKATEKSKDNSAAGKKSAKLKKIRKEINIRLQYISENTGENFNELQQEFNVNSTDVDFLLQRNSTIKIREDKIREDKRIKDKINNNNSVYKKVAVVEALDLFKKQIGGNEGDSWREIFYMKLKYKKGCLSKIADEFKADFILREHSPPKTLKDYKEHLLNWVNVQDRLNKFDKYKLKSGKSLLL